MSIAVLNCFMDTLGGGERSTLAYARALRELLGEEVFIYTLSKGLSARRLESAFGISLEGISIVSEESESKAFARLCRSRHSVFVNHSHGSRLPNPSRFGLFSMMFPANPEGSPLETYDAILCNSGFTARYTAMRWPQLLDRVEVVPPPLAARGVKVRWEQKDWRLAANIGRFNRLGHDKKQLQLGMSIDRANQRVFRSPMKLRCVGRVGDEDYFEACRQQQNENISFERDLGELAIAGLLEQAGLYIHCTGLGLDYGERPQDCEHFGLAILEAMDSGCIPIACDRGGASEFIRHGWNGFLYHTMDELVEILQLLEDWPVQHLADLADRSRVTAAEYTFDKFQATLSRTLAKLGSTPARTARSRTATAWRYGEVFL